MKKKIRNNYLISTLFFALFVLFTVLVKSVDVNPVGPQGSLIGFSTINIFVFEFLGQSSVCYIISEVIGYAAIIIALIFTVLGFLQMAQRKSILKTDFEILALGALYVLTVFAYIFFEVIVVNYRPVLVEGLLEASYPSSHTILVIVILGSAIMQIDWHIKNKRLKTTLKVLLLIAIIATVFGRLASGLHWFTDVVGGVLLASFLSGLYYSAVIDVKCRQKIKVKK